MNSINEIIGRLWIWETSLLRTKRLLLLASSAYTDFQEKQHEARKDLFPTEEECDLIFNSSIELAIVYFCQILNQGEKKSDTAAANELSFRDEHLKNIIIKIFKTKDEYQKFNCLKSKILKARNKMITHADASSYNIIHGSTSSSLKLPQPWHEIDLNFFASIIEPLITEIRDYSNNIKSKNK